MTHEELNAIVDGISRPLMEKLQAANQRIAELETRLAAMPATIQPAPIDVEAIAERAAALIKPPKDGQDAPPVDVDSIVLRVAELIPPPKDGEPGPKGDKGDPGESIKGDPGEPGARGETPDIVQTIRDSPEIIRELLLPMIPAPIKGDKGDPGESIKGDRGEPGERGETPDVVQWIRENRQGIRDAIMPMIPAPIKGDKGEPGKDGANGKDAVLPDIAGMIDSGIRLRFADWAVDQERHAQEVFRRAIEAMPKPQDGKDGLGFEDMEILDDGAGTVTLSFKRGELEKSRTIRFPWQEHMGVWKEGNTYRYGNDVTWAGSVWRCLVESTIQKPGNGSSDWRLIVKRGEDGRNGKDGQRGDTGPQGPPGRDLTQMGFDGRKY